MSKPVVISSITGKPMDWEPENGSEGGAGEKKEPSRPILPDRVDEDQPEPGESNDARLAGDVPPHWGRGH